MFFIVPQSSLLFPKVLYCSQSYLQFPKVLDSSPNFFIVPNSFLVPKSSFQFPTVLYSSQQIFMVPNRSLWFPTDLYSSQQFFPVPKVFQQFLKIIDGYELSQYFTIVSQFSPITPYRQIVVTFVNYKRDLPNEKSCLQSYQNV